MRKARTPESDPVLAQIIQRRNDDGWDWTAIGREQRMATASASQMYARYYQRIGEVPPVVGRSQPVVSPGGPMVIGHADVPNPDAAPQPVAGTPGVSTVATGGVSQRVVIQAERRQGWRQSILVTSDHHFDHVHCDRELLRFHLNQARERSAGVLVLGDLFCAMQGKTDRRAAKPDLRPEYLVDAYADAIVDDAIDWYTPYADLIWLISYGNHESKYQSYHETDILRRLHRGLQRTPGANILLGTYAGWLSFDLDFGDGDAAQRLRLRYHHGWGGGGPVTLGTIGTNRQAAAADYDIYAQGHIHEQWSVTRMRETVGPDGRMVVRRVPHICAGTYKAEGGGGMGWHVETGKPPKPSGGYWLHLYWSERQQCVLPKTEEVEL